MLVLSRRTNESLNFTITRAAIAALAIACRGVDIQIKAVRIGPQSVRLGIVAPPEVSITRPEVIDAAISHAAERSGG